MISTGLAPVILAGIAALMSGVSRLSAIMVLRVGMRVVGHFALVFMLLGAIGIYVLGLTSEVPSPFVLGFLMLVVGSALSAVLANFQAIALAPHEKIAGAAAAVAGATMTFMGTALQSYLASATGGGVAGLGLGLTIGLGLACLVILIVERGKPFQPEVYST
jgi:DHA1 family bicyclomycin/chloramphenicol resistance-like MFS transporter